MTTFSALQNGYSSAMTRLLFGIVLAFTVIQFAVSRHLGYYKDSQGCFEESLVRGQIASTGEKPYIVNGRRSDQWPNPH